MAQIYRFFLINKNRDIPIIYSIFAKRSNSTHIGSPDTTIIYISLSLCSVNTDEEEKHGRSKRSSTLDTILVTDSNRHGRKFCENGSGV